MTLTALVIAALFLWGVWIFNRRELATAQGTQ